MTDHDAAAHIAYMRARCALHSACVMMRHATCRPSRRPHQHGPRHCAIFTPRLRSRLSRSRERRERSAIRRRVAKDLVKGE
jgi:hypothetical protein